MTVHRHGLGGTQRTTVNRDNWRWNDAVFRRANHVTARAENITVNSLVWQEINRFAHNHRRRGLGPAPGDSAFCVTGWVTGGGLDFQVRLVDVDAVLTLATLTFTGGVDPLPTCKQATFRLEDGIYTLAVEAIKTAAGIGSLVVEAVNLDFTES